MKWRALGCVPLLAAAIFVSGCGGGQYVHDAGNCSIKNGRVQIVVQAWRDKNVPDAEASTSLRPTCKAAFKALHRP